MAERTGIALPTVSKLLKLLHEAELISSIRGINGGYRLDKNPEQMSLTEIIAAVDGSPALTECCQPDKSCIHDARCGMRDQWRFINQIIVNALSQFTLADLNKVKDHVKDYLHGSGQ